MNASYAITKPPGSKPGRPKSALNLSHPDQVECEKQAEVLPQDPVQRSSRSEQAFGKLKRFKRVALRCEKTLKSFTSIISLALGFTLLKPVHTA